MIWTLQSMFGQLFDAMVGQMVHVLGGPRPVHRSSPWEGASPRERPLLPPAPLGAEGSPGTLTTSPPSPASGAAWEPARGGALIVVREESRPAPEKDLDDDAVKLVKYGIVSIRLCHERVIFGGKVLVTIPMTSESFAAWIVARYLQSPEYRAAVASDRRNEISREEKKYLRVSYGVVARWPREPEDCCDDERKLDALRRIRDAIRAFSPRPVRPAVAPPALPPPSLPAEPAAEPAAERAEPSEEEQAVLQALGELGGTAATSQLVRQTGLPQSQVRKAIKGLQAAGLVRRLGEGLQTRYQAVAESGGPEPPAPETPRPGRGRAGRSRRRPR